MRRLQVSWIEMNAVMGSFLSQMLDRRQILQTALSGAFNSNAAAFSTYVKIWGVDDLPRGGDLQGLPYPVAPSIDQCARMSRCTTALLTGPLDLSM
jgi:hypothetical protein